MRCLIVLLLMFMTVSAFAEDKSYNLGEIVVTPDRLSEPINETGTSVNVIESETIDEKGSASVSDVLRGVPGISIARNGGLGTLTSVYIRGAESDHTLVMIDGIEMNDPISPTRTFDWAHLLTDDIERIEVVKGPQSTLYGSDAMGGVINIITKEGKGKPNIGLFLEGGSYYTYRQTGYSGGVVGKTDYSVSLSHISSEGFSIVEGGSEKDGYDNMTFNGKLGYKITDNAKLHLVLRYLDAHNDLDNDIFDDDPNYKADVSNFSGYTGIEHNVKDWWKYKLNFSWLTTYNKYRNPPDEMHTFDDTKSWYDGADYKGDWQNTIALGDMSTIVGGIEYKEEQGSSFSRMTSSFGDFISEFPRKTIDTVGIYLQDTIKLWERLLVTAGGRYEDNHSFGEHTDYKIWGSYSVPKIETRLKASVGTGFKAPSLFQLYSIYGDTELQPEQVQSYDIGFEQPLFSERLVGGITYFHNKFTDLIDWDDALWKYRNISKAMTEGIEAEINWIVCSKLNAGITYTYLKTEDETTGKELDRRPRNSCGFNLSWYPTEKYILRFDMIYVGKRKDVNYTVFPYEQVTLHSYAVANISIHYKVNPNFELFGRIENLFDEKYEEVYGFNTPRISAYGGLKVEF